MRDRESRNQLNRCPQKGIFRFAFPGNRVRAIFHTSLRNRLCDMQFSEMAEPPIPARSRRDPLMAPPRGASLAASIEKRSETVEAARDPFWTLPNSFSLLRMVLVAPAVWLVWLGPASRWWALACILSMAATDFLDGHLARRRGQFTRWGRILDPLADKIAIGSVAVALVFARGLSPWLAGMVIGRDIIILFIGAVTLRQVRVVPVSNFWGKLTTLLMSLVGIIFVTDVDVLKMPVTVTAAGTIAVSSVSYVIRILRGRCWA